MHKTWVNLQRQHGFVPTTMSFMQWINVCQEHKTLKFNFGKLLGRHMMSDVKIWVQLWTAAIDDSSHHLHS